MLFFGFNTVNGKDCCNLTRKLKQLTVYCFNTVNGKYCCNKMDSILNPTWILCCFNTVNGKYCCNAKRESKLMESILK
mgnify:CR=1 FL=1